MSLDKRAVKWVNYRDGPDEMAAAVAENTSQMAVQLSEAPNLFRSADLGVKVPPTVPLTIVWPQPENRTCVDSPEGVRELAPDDAVIPQRYLEMSVAELDRRIRAAREKLGSRVVLLGHHYQRDEIVQYADFRGDSYKLSQLAAGRKDAEYIVFCGVHFMAESADILSGDHQSVILPNLEAGCSMADMADIDDVEDCWAQLRRETDARVVPITYMNSAASLKAFCGRNGGIVCTSANAPAVFEWAFARGEKLLFFPDQHLGRNTALKMGLTDRDMILWNPRRPLGGNTPEDVERARVILWLGWCATHLRFKPEQIRLARERYPDVTVLVHPECRRDVVELADLAGSTEFIIDTVTRAPAGSVWAVGTEINLVNRLAQENPDKSIFCLDPVVCPCSTMYRIHPAYLAWVLEGLVEGRAINRITVDPTTKAEARVALERMLTVR